VLSLSLVPLPSPGALFLRFISVPHAYMVLVYVGPVHRSFHPCLSFEHVDPDICCIAACKLGQEKVAWYYCKLLGI